MFDDPYKPKNIKITVKHVNGTWEFFYGGHIPIKEGAIGDLTVDESAITDKGFLALIKDKKRLKILNQGVELRVALSVKKQSDLNTKLTTHLIIVNYKEIKLNPYFGKTHLTQDTRFVSIKVGAPSENQVKFHNEKTGGLWLDIQGLQPKGLISSTIDLPEGVADGPAISLNHAFTLLSQVYEPWRKSHTGNIYTKMFYKENNGFWYPLEALRNIAIAQEEDELIKGQWRHIAEELGLNFNP